MMNKTLFISRMGSAKLVSINQCVKSQGACCVSVEMAFDQLCLIKSCVYIIEVTFIARFFLKLSCLIVAH